MDLRVSRCGALNHFLAMVQPNGEENVYPKVSKLQNEGI